MCADGDLSTVISHGHFLPLSFRAIVLASALLASGARLAHTQSPVDTSTGRKNAQQSARADRLSSAGSLELTADQKTKLMAISNKHADEGRAVAELFRIDPDAAMKRMVALRTKMQAEVRLVLTPEQRTIFDRNVAEMNAQMNAHLQASPR
jgi:hypothetical protein